MRLTAILYHLKNKRPHGIAYRGKYRKVRVPSHYDLMSLRFDFEREERNMLLLRHPYLSVEQSRGHMAEIKDLFPKKDVIFLSREERNAKFNKHFTWSNQFDHLRVTDAWE